MVVVGATPCGRPLHANESKPRALDNVRGFCVQTLDRARGVLQITSL